MNIIFYIDMISSYKNFTKLVNRSITRSLLSRGISSSNISLSTPSPPSSFFDQVGRDWDVAWKKNVTPWDLNGSPSPPISTIMKESEGRGKKICQTIIPFVSSILDKKFSLDKFRRLEYEYLKFLDENRPKNEDEENSSSSLSSLEFNQLIENIDFDFSSMGDLPLTDEEIFHLLKLRFLFGTLMSPPDSHIHRLFNYASSSTLHPPLSPLNVLVPGCGAGYDCVMFAARGADKVIGLDLSPTAMKVAEVWLINLISSLEKKDNEKLTYPSLTLDLFQSTQYGNQDIKNKIHFISGDFFAFGTDKFVNSRQDDSLSPEEYQLKFSHIFDYTFFVALDPGLRPKWAEGMKRNLIPKTGVLATLLFPLSPVTLKDEEAQGPPYPITLENYKKVLDPLGFEIIGIEKEINSIKPRQGKEILVYWRIK